MRGFPNSLAVKADSRRSGDALPMPMKSSARIAQSGIITVSRMFNGIDGAALERILSVLPPVRLPGGAHVFDRGDPGGVMFLVIEGTIEISVFTETGRKVALNIIEPGNCFGEIGMYDRLDRTASAIALETSVLQPVNRSTFVQAMEQHPVLARNLIDILCERVRWMSDSVEDYALLPLEQRLARRVLTLYSKLVRSDGSIEISQSDLADFAGASREATNKILIAWKEAGLIELGRKSLVLTRREKLEALAQKNAL
jgi:CRP/FNR family transcriptional regulator, cyclic AMP receptor protein